MADNSPDSARLAWLDQYRGYTVLGMFIVNFLGSYVAIKSFLPLLAHHHTFCSYADTIMPQFLFAVGFAYRLTFLRRQKSHGSRSAYLHILKRNFSLLLVAFVVHHLDGRYDSWAKIQELGISGFFTTSFQRSYFQTLTHIAVTSLWVMPVIAAKPGWRIVYAIVSGLLFHLLSVYAGYYEWVLKRPGIDGGPLGFLTWTIPLLVGTLTFDALADPQKVPYGRLLAWAVGLMLLGYTLSCLNRVTPPNEAEQASDVFVEPPFVAPSKPVNIWTMSQRAGSITYLTFSAGFSLAVAVLFILLERVGLRWSVFDTMGRNALAGYILHDWISDAVKPFVPRDAPLWYLFVAVAVFLLLCFVFLRYLEKHRLFLRL